MDEIWITIKDFDKYQISNLGRIKSLYYNKVLKSGKDPHGYLHVSLYKNGIAHTKNIHIIVARTFIPNPLNLPEINHIDGNKENCAVSNLEHSTKSDNEKHARKIGLKSAIKGEKNNFAKLTEIQVKEIRELKGKLKQREIAAIYNIHRATISLIHLNKNWKYI
jgi:DNA-binding transcriptional regulator YiaG